MQRESRVLRFVLDLADAEAPEGFRNPYAGSEAAHNLLLFLTRRDHHERTVLLIGEAPGYRGAALSGVALSSIATLTEPWSDPWRSFGPDAGYRIPASARHMRESTATIVWRCLAESFAASPIPLTWNAVPFHPWQGHIDSNASLPRRSLNLGRPWVEKMLDLFPNARPVAVGVRACEALCELEVEHDKVRHPSRGGKTEFAAGLLRVNATFG